MWDYSLGTHARSSSFIIRARINVKLMTGLDEYYKKLHDMRGKLEMMMPGTFKAKYNMSIDGLLVQIHAKNAGEANRIAYQVENFIKSAILALR